MRAVASHARKGFTLIELLIVMSLVALILGLGLGVFANLDVGGRVAVGNVQNALRAGHNWAVARSAPARIVIDAGANTMRTEGNQVVGTWHFEDDSLRGAFGIDGVKFGGEIVPDGFQGRALSFANQPPRSHVDFPVQLDPAWDPSDGFTVRFALRTNPGGGVLLDLGGSLGIETTADGALKAFFLAQRTDDETSTGRGGRVAIATEPHALTNGRWEIVDVQYDRVRFSIRIGGQVAAFVAESAPVSRLQGPLSLSPAQNAFPGAIDALVVSVVVADEPVELPQGVTFAKGVPRQIVFQPGGGLDREIHREPARIVLEFEDARQETVQVNLFGTVE